MHTVLVLWSHYNDAITGAIASQITSFTIVYSTVYSVTEQRKHQSSASLAYVRGIHRWPVKSPHKGPVTRKMFSFDDVIITLWFPVDSRNPITHVLHGWSAGIGSIVRLCQRHGSVAQMPQCISPISLNTPCCNRNVHMCAHFCYKMVHWGIWDGRTVTVWDIGKSNRPQTTTKHNKVRTLCILGCKAQFNPLRAKFFRVNINIYLHFMPFIHTNKT